MKDSHHPTFNQNDVQVIKHELLYQGFLRINRYTLSHALFNGGMSPQVSYEVMTKNPAVAVLPYDPRLKKVILIEQFRAGLLDSLESPWTIECVAGTRDPLTESPTAVAQRETREEAGLTVSELISICDYWVSPGCSQEKTAVFCGKVDASQAGGIYGLETENEDIRAKAWDLSAACAAMSTGKINNASTIIALQWLQLNLSTVHAKWSESL